MRTKVGDHPREGQAESGPELSVAEAVDALAREQSVMLPVEGGWVLAAAISGKGATAVARWASAQGGLGSRLGPVRLVQTADEVLEILQAANGGKPISGVGPRIIKRLLPGPALITLSGGVSEGDVWSARAPSVQPTEAIIEQLARSGTGLLCVEVVNASGEMIDDINAAGRAAALAGTAMGGHVNRRGEVFSGRRSATVIEVPSSTAGSGRTEGGFTILREGGYESRYVRKQVGMNILFVCTGNTCRSPMAEQIAGSLLNGEFAGAATAGIRVSSAGTGAGSGSSASSETLSAVRSLGLGANTLASHRSRPLSRKLIADADMILTMSRSHREAVLELEPDAADKVQVLDPSGQDVPDPIGMGQDVYDRTARRIMEVIRARFKELGW